MANECTKNSKAIMSIFNVSVSNLIKLLSGVLAAFLIPKIMGIEDYGVYKTFTLYATYVGVFQIGFTDGIYLKYGDKNFNSLDKNKFSCFSLFFIGSQLLFCFIFFCVGLFFFNGKYQFLVLSLALFLLTTNSIAYYQMISQITLRFDELSIRNIVQSLLNSLSIVGLFIIYKYKTELISFEWYIIIVITINSVLLIWYMVTYRSITFSKPTISGAMTEIISCIRYGLPLMIANLCSTFILLVDRQFVNILFDNETYAIYAFSYNLLALITTVTSAISVVLYPTMKRESIDKLILEYPYFCGCLSIFIFACCFFYFPMTRFIGWFLPQYVEALPIFRIVLPGLAFQSIITIVMHNYYKNSLKEVLFFFKSVIILILSIIANIIAFHVFKTPTSISIASIIVMLVWYISIERYLIREYKVKYKNNFGYLCLMSVVFYLASCHILLWWLNMVLYLFVYGIITLIFFKKDITSYFKWLKKES